MLSRGEYRENGKEYGLIVKSGKNTIEIVMTRDNVVHSAYKKERGGQFSYNNNDAKKIADMLQRDLRACTAKNARAVPFVKGTAVRHDVSPKGKRSITDDWTKIRKTIDKFNGVLVGAEIQSDIYLYLEYYEKDIMPKGIQYIRLAARDLISEFEEGDMEDRVTIRKLQEVGLDKDLRWLKGKKYYIVNDEETAERILKYLDEYEGPIAFDVETTGLRINMFGKINSNRKRELEEYNANVDNPDDIIEVDSLVGVVLCVEPNVSYYLPVKNRKFKNLYEDTEGAIRKRTASNIKSRYMVGDLRNKEGDMADYIRNTPMDAWETDVVLMERLRHILETKHIVAHNGAFEWKVSWLYDICLSLKDDTMILHQLMYKFRSGTSNRGESSSLSDIEKREFGIDALELKDFFPDLVEDKKGKVRGKEKASNKIDFSYMTYEEARCYACSDGDYTLQIMLKYKRDMVDNYKELDYIYNVELIMSSAIGYMEFYGHRLDEDRIERALQSTELEMIYRESQLRQLAGYAGEGEIEQFRVLEGLMGRLAKESNDPDFIREIRDRGKQLSRVMAEDDERAVNWGSPMQVARVFYDEMGIPIRGDKRSVAEAVIKPYTRLKDEHGEYKYPIVKLYMDWKKCSTLITKFFGNLQDFMYPGGFVFSSYGQITAATGRMSCSKPNAQQYPRQVREIVVPRKGFVMMDADFSQIEYRVLVALAKEQGLLKKFEGPDVDYHTLMASLMYEVPYASVTSEMRDDAKGFNFGIPYGMGFKSLAIRLTGRSGPTEIEEAMRKYELYFKEQPRVRKFFEDVKEEVKILKYTKTFWNRRRYYSFTDREGNVSNMIKAMALRQAGNAVIQGTAADIFKIATARCFTFIVNNGLLGKLLISNMIHDELLFEINCKELNVQRALKEILNCMQFKVKGFPPLFAGAGFGDSWEVAKDSHSEIHPYLAEELASEVEDVGLRDSVIKEPEEVVKYFSERLLRFRRQRIIDYVLDESNWGNDIEPVIGSLINAEFADEVSKDLQGRDITIEALRIFIDKNNLGVDIANFGSANTFADEEESTEYSDGDEENLDGEEEIQYTEFALVDEDDSLFGVSLHDMISTFGLMVSKDKKVCGIDVRTIPNRNKDEIVDYLMKHQCDSGEEGAMQVVFLKNNNVLFDTGVWVKGIEGSEVACRLKLNTLMYT